MPATDQERALDHRMEELGAMGYGVEVERIANDISGGWMRTGWRWRAVLKQGFYVFPESGGATAEIALENAVDAARGFGAPI
jgi:hypothetical protein